MSKATINEPTMERYHSILNPIMMRKMIIAATNTQMIVQSKTSFLRTDTTSKHITSMKNARATVAIVHITDICTLTISYQLCIICAAPTKNPVLEYISCIPPYRSPDQRRKICLPRYRQHSVGKFFIPTQCRP